MSELEVPGRGMSRRAVARAAVWSVPAVTAVVAAPAFAASVPTAPSALEVTGTQSGLLTLRVLDSATTLRAATAVSVPNEVSVTLAGAGGSSGTATVTVVVDRPVGIDVPFGRARGFGVHSFDGVPTTTGERSATYQSAAVVGQYGFPRTQFSRAISLAGQGGSSVPLPFVLGLAGVSTGVAITALARFPVTVTLSVGSAPPLVATSEVTVAVDAGVL